MERSPQLGEHALEQGCPLEQARGPELPLAALKCGSPPLPSVPLHPPGQIWGGPGSEDGILAAASSRAQTCFHSALWALGGHLARLRCGVPVPQRSSGRARNPCPLSPCASWFPISS